MKKEIFILLAFTPIVLFSSSTENVETDIVQRTFNFIIFASIIYYLLSDKIRVFFKNRSISIKSDLNKVEELLLESVKNKEEANDKLKQSENIAKDIVSNANNQIDKIKYDTLKSIDNTISKLEDSYNDKITFEMRRIKKEVVSEILNELLDSNNIFLSDEDLSNIILKKVS